ncbi:MAG: aminotransferase class I/II-fold pyridoxal phosphate-dependent enzyme [Acidobacteriia bacterium]|nr:aminotransferase class I/II-fold pyridoxal phosphate-dependent enzyme [Terriglobia bacterium]
MSKKITSFKSDQFTESVIREMTRLAIEYKALNLAQGFPDFAAPAEIKAAAKEAIDSDINQYAITWGARSFRHAIAGKVERTLGLSVDPETEITVCCGATECMMSTMLAIINPGDEVIIFEPFYENYGPDVVISDATPRFVRLQPPGKDDPTGVWHFDRAELEGAFNERTKAIVINTPNNPTGKVFTREELEFIASLCLRWNTLAITDEIYEHILFDGARHVAMATLDGMRERTVLINGMSKTYSVTGWRVGYAVAPPEITNAIRKMHDFVSVGAPAPLQEAGAMAMQFPPSYYEQLAVAYLHRRDRVLDLLSRAGFRCFKPFGAYYIMTDISEFGFRSDVEFAEFLVREVGVAAVPGSSFYKDPVNGRHYLRFAFCKTEATLAEAEARLSMIGSKLKRLTR